MAISAGRCLDVLHALKYKLDRSTLEKLYVAFIRSKLEYGNIIWDNCAKYLVEFLENVQFRAAKIISGAINRSNRELVYKELGWETLEERRCQQRLSTMHKIINNDAPAYLQNTIPQNEHSRYNLRNQGNIPPIKCKSAAYQKSFFPQTIKDWNKLDKDTRNIETTESFKRQLTSKYRENSPPTWYSTGDRYFSMIHSRLRMLCSPLNDHLFSHIHVIDSPQCARGHDRETARHFLLECPLFYIERLIMLNDMQNINFDPIFSNLLYGNNKYNEETNIKGFQIIQKFVKDSNRFTI